MRNLLGSGVSLYNKLMSTILKLQAKKFSIYRKQ